MKILIILLLLIAPAVHAQRSLERETFMGNVRPVLNGILSDFYQMVILFPDFPKEIIPLLEEIDALSSDKEALRELCPSIVTNKCKTPVNALRDRLSTIRDLSLKLLKSQRMSPLLYMNSVSGLRLVTDLDLEIEEIKGELSNISFLQAAQIGERRETNAVIKNIDEMTTIASLAVVEYVPFLYREDFRHFYFNFIHPIKQQMTKNKNYEFLNKNVHSLNFAINLLNMQLTKRKKTPEGMAPFLATMHNRWNSILRYYW